MLWKEVSRLYLAELMVFLFIFDDYESFYFYVLKNTIQLTVINESDQS